MKPMEYWKHRGQLIPHHIEEAYTVIKEWERVLSCRCSSASQNKICECEGIGVCWRDGKEELIPTIDRSLTE